MVCISIIYLSIDLPVGARCVNLLQGRWFLSVDLQAPSVHKDEKKFREPTRRDSPPGLSPERRMSPGI